MASPYSQHTQKNAEENDPCPSWNSESDETTDLLTERRWKVYEHAITELSELRQDLQTVEGEVKETHWKLSELGQKLERLKQGVNLQELEVQRLSELLEHGSSPLSDCDED